MQTYLKLYINTEKNVFDWLKWVKKMLKYFKTKEPLVNKSLGSSGALIYKKSLQMKSLRSIRARIASEKNLALAFKMRK